MEASNHQKTITQLARIQLKCCYIPLKRTLQMRSTSTRDYNQRPVMPMLTVSQTGHDSFQPRLSHRTSEKSEITEKLTTQYPIVRLQYPKDLNY